MSAGRTIAEIEDLYEDENWDESFDLQCPKCNAPAMICKNESQPVLCVNTECDWGYEDTRLYSGY